MNLFNRHSTEKSERKETSSANKTAASETLNKNNEGGSNVENQDNNNVTSKNPSNLKGRSSQISEQRQLVQRLSLDANDDDDDIFISNENEWHQRFNRLSNRFAVDEHNRGKSLPSHRNQRRSPQPRNEWTLHAQRNSDLNESDYEQLSYQSSNIAGEQDRQFSKKPNRYIYYTLISNHT